MRRRKRDLTVLLVIWVSVAIYAGLVLSNPEVEGVWRFAAIAPAVLIALFLSAFSYQAIVDARGLQRGIVTPTLQLAMERHLLKLGLLKLGP